MSGSGYHRAKVYHKMVMQTACIPTRTDRETRLLCSLDEAVSAYCSGETRTIDSGAVVERVLAAMHQELRAQDGATQWIYLRVAVKPGAQTSVAICEVASCIDECNNHVAISQWWWLNKWDPLGPALRVRIQTPTASARETTHLLLSCLEKRGLEATLPRYEPELLLFGGHDGIEIAHRLFAIDSMFLVSWLRSTEARNLPVVPPGLSFALVMHLARGAGLDLFEQWDLFDRLAAKRTAGPEQNATEASCIRIVKQLLAAPAESLLPIFSDPLRVLVKKHLDNLQNVGMQIAQAYFGGRLDCGLREFLVPVVLFHWNRIGLAASAQGGFARAAAQELRHLSREGREARNATTPA